MDRGAIDDEQRSASIGLVEYASGWRVEGAARVEEGKEEVAAKVWPW